jgi:hypothetical protein
VLYTKPIDEISWQDIEVFCQQGIPEGAYLDYKAQFPSHLERTIAAMANTLGGIILVGVQADSQNKPQLPVPGVSLVPGLSERVTQIVLTNLTPPVFPEIGICENPAKSHAVVVIRVPQSHQTPHAIAHNTDVYLRTGDRNQPEERADLDKIEWLRHQRETSVKLRERLYERAIKRVIDFHELRAEAERGAVVPTPARIDRGWFEASLVPMYPQQMLKTPPELAQSRSKIDIQDRYRATGKFPMPWSVKPRIVQDAVVLSESYEELTFHTELNSFGLFFYSQSLLHNPTGYSSDPFKEPVMSSAEIFWRLNQVCEAGSKYYELLGYWGPLLFQLELKGIRGCPLTMYPIQVPYTLHRSPDNELRFSETIPGGGLQDIKSNLVLRAAQHVAWTFGLNVSGELLDQLWSEGRK